MKEDGTINRAALPAIFNPEDLNALEQALRLKDKNPGSTVTILTMGLPRAAEVIREAIYRGADAGHRAHRPRALGGADTLATSYSLGSGRQRNSVNATSSSAAVRLSTATPPGRPSDSRKARYSPGDIRRRDPRSEERICNRKTSPENGVETVKAPLPCVVTVNGSAAECRPRNARRVMKYKYAVSPSEKEKLSRRSEENSLTNALICSRRMGCRIRHMPIPNRLVRPVRPQR